MNIERNHIKVYLSNKVFLLVLIVSLVFIGCNGQIEKIKPNILLIVSEDNGPDLGCYGNTNVYTPNLDRLSAEGVQFNNAFVTYSVCSPSRSTIFTGLYPHQNGQIGLATHKYRMYEGIKTLPVYLREAGYRSGCIGKVDVNPESEIPWDYRPGGLLNGANFGKKSMPEYAAKSME
ncbi:MAG: sulfatase-like hydrolase/transferase, partial [Cyclobacteriaceae bacterium]|nr:sulfatase-like hydrolase/transferase [Cyclobacteriaceae bacterium]